MFRRLFSKSTFAFSAFSALCLAVSTQSTLQAEMQLEWVARHDSSYGGWDVADASAVDATGNVYISGISSGVYFLLKYAGSGEMLWRTQLESPEYVENSVPIRSDVVVSSDGMVFVAWPTASGFAVAGYDESGTELWSRAWDFPEGGEPHDAIRLATRSTGGVYAACGTSRGAGCAPIGMALCLNSDGREVWSSSLPSHCLELGGTSQVQDVTVGRDGSFHLLFLNWTMAWMSSTIIKYSPTGELLCDNFMGWDPRSMDVDGNGNVYLTHRLTVKMSPTGQEVWRRESSGIDIAADSGGVYVLKGYPESTPSLLKLDFEGDEIWTRDLEGPVAVPINMSDTYRWGYLMLADGGTVYAAYSRGGFDEFNIESEILLARYDPQGNGGSLFRVKGGEGRLSVQIEALCELPGGDLVVAGNTSDINDPGHQRNRDILMARGTARGEVLWTARYDGPGGNDQATAVVADQEGNAYVSGLTVSRGVTTVKIDPEGTELWNALLPVDGNFYETSDVQLALTGEDQLYVHVNFYRKGPNQFDPYYGYSITGLYDSDGNLLRSFENRFQTHWPSTAFVVDASGNAYLSEKQEDGTGVVKYDKEGNRVWASRVEGLSTAYPEPCSLAVDPDGSLYAGFVAASDVALIKYAPDGSQRWHRTFDHHGDSCLSVGLDLKGNVYVAGSGYEDWDTDHDVFALKYSSAGEVLWQTVLDTPSRDVPSAAKVGSDGTVVVTGRRRTVKFEPTGDIAWEREHGSFERQEATALALDERGHVYVTGRSSPDPTTSLSGWATLEYGPDGNLLAMTRYEELPEPELFWSPVHPKPRALCVSDAGSIYIAGGIGGGSDYVTLKYSLAYPRFIRGDANADDNTDLSDAVFVLNYLFLGGSPPSCKDATDTDDTGNIDITDAVYLLNFLFLGGSPPRAPFPDCGLDPTVDELTCLTFEGCGD